MTPSPNPSVPDADQNADVLASGTALFHGQYTIESFLSSGGFGITYLARDSLDRQVVVKECFPRSLCIRNNKVVQSRPRTPREDFHSIVRLFVQEARNLARLKHPNIVGVHQIFEDNGTAYMALDYIRGRELLEAIEDGSVPREPAAVTALLDTMLDTVEFIHREGVLHRDISPDNILIRADNSPVLIDFGAARAGARLSGHARTVLLAVKDGYSPQEFYITGAEQKPASDLYALAATFHHLILGEAPPNSDERLAAAAEQAPDPMVPIAERARDLGYEPRFLEAIDKALSVFSKDRFQSAVEWKAYINQFEVARPDASMSLALARRREAVNSKVRHLERPRPPAGSSPLIMVTKDRPGLEPARDACDAQAASPVRPTRPVTASRGTEPAARPATAPRAQSEATAADVPLPPAPRASGKAGLLLGGVAAAALVVGAFVHLSGSSSEPAADAAPDRVADGGAAPAAAEAPAPALLVPGTAAQGPAPTLSIPAGDSAAASGEGTATARPDGAAPEAVAAAAPVPALVVPGGAPASAPTLRVPEPAGAASAPDAPQPVVAPAPEGLAAVTGESFDAAAPGAEGGSPVRYFSTLDDAAPEAAPRFDAAAPEPTGLAAAAPGASATPGAVLDAAAVMSGWVVDLPFTAGADTTIESVAPGAPDWMRPGLSIVSVGGVPVASVDDMRQVIRASGEPGADGTWPVTFGVRDAGSADGAVFAAELAATRQTALLNGLRFRAAPGRDGWRTMVAESPFATEDALLTGDELVAILSTSEEVTGATTLPETLARELGAGRTRFSFAVRRGGDLWVVSMDYAAAAN